MAGPSAWTCPECGVVGLASPEKLPATEFPEEQLVALHQWARAFDRYCSKTKRSPVEYNALDFAHWLLANQRLHRHATARHEPAGRPGRIRLEARATAA
jgi:hypothetical protein